MSIAQHVPAYLQDVVYSRLEQIRQKLQRVLRSVRIYCRLFGSFLGVVLLSAGVGLSASIVYYILAQFIRLQEIVLLTVTHVGSAITGIILHARLRGQELCQLYRAAQSSLRYIEQSAEAVRTLMQLCAHLHSANPIARGLLSTLPRIPDMQRLYEILDRLDIVLTDVLAQGTDLGRGRLRQVVRSLVNSSREVYVLINRVRRHLQQLYV